MGDREIVSVCACVYISVCVTGCVGVCVCECVIYVFGVYVCV